MRRSTAWTWLIFGCLVGSTTGAVVPASPLITPAPEVDARSLEKRQGILDAVSYAQLLLTAVPQSLRQLAVTNAPAFTSVLNEEFLDDNKPQWFRDLPSDVQSYLVRQFGPSTAWQTASSTASDASTTQSASIDPSSSASSSFTSATASNRQSSAAPSPSLSNGAESQSSEKGSGLSNGAKIGLGVGIPLALLALAALILCCCCLLRRRRRKADRRSDGTSSPGFIPRFAFQDKSTEQLEHRRPLNPALNRSTGHLGAGGWDEQGVDPFEPTPTHAAQRHGPMANDSEKMAMTDATPIMAGALHTHSSNRARGTRTSYTSLHSVAEEAEPDERRDLQALRRSPRKPSLKTPLAPIPAVAAAAAIKRKPVPSSPTEGSTLVGFASSNPSSREQSYSRSRSSNSSGFPPLSVKSNRSSSGSYAVPESPISPVSPITNSALFSHPPNDTNRHSLPESLTPGRRRPSYTEDYGPEYANSHTRDSGLYGGSTNFDRYPAFETSIWSPSSNPARNKNSKTEWPLRNMMGNGHSGVQSPQYERVYE